MEKVIDEIVESAVAWVSDDADHPDTPSKEWQDAIVLIKAAPKMVELLKTLRAEICTNPAITDTFWIGDAMAGTCAVDLITEVLNDDWDYSVFMEAWEVSK